MPPGQIDSAAWAIAWQNKWIADPKLPLTVVSTPDTVVMTPPCDPLFAFAFTRRMVACPLTKNGPPGSVPNGRSGWWQRYFNTSATGHAKRAWVQGHLLNHNIHGQGTEDNLVPITDALNRIMEKWAEKFVKEFVSKGMILAYEVIVHWNAAAKVGSGHDWLNNAKLHPKAMHQAYGDELRLGECMAPTSVEWHCWEVTWHQNQWVPLRELELGGIEGIESHIYANSWNQ